MIYTEIVTDVPVLHLGFALKQSEMGYGKVYMK